jgi:hypothetical protein
MPCCRQLSCFSHIDTAIAQLVLFVKLFLDAFEVEFTEGDEQRG